jgi:mannose-6-phosphate isomerase
MSKSNKVVNRPWGTYENLLDDKLCKVKKIVVNPGEHPSYQMHDKRAETWFVLSGCGVVKINEVEKSIGPSDIISVPIRAKHTIRNSSNKDKLVFIEIQTGTYFGEDDIVRFEDKYGRI